MQIEEQLHKQVVRLADEAQVCVYTAGQESGPPIVLLHGGGTDHALLSWRETRPVLIESGYKVYAPDYPGYGQSPPDRRPATMGNLVGYLAELMDLWRLEQAALVGISMGAAIALGCALN